MVRAASAGSAVEEPVYGKSALPNAGRPALACAGAGRRVAGLPIVLAILLLGLGLAMPALANDPLPVVTPASPPVPAAAAGLAVPHDLSPLGMFMAADWVVKAVMLALGAASVLTWTILIVKSLQIARARSNLRRDLLVLGEASSLGQAATLLPDPRHAVGQMLAIARREMAASEPALDHAGHQGLKDRLASALARLELSCGRQMASGTGLLATIGSIGPFVGLFGTVWGIMNAFIGISRSQTTSLAVVAPGIAEALLATAIGLVAAIPAVVIYNVFARAISAYRQQMGDAGAAIERLVSRDLDFRAGRSDPPVARLKAVTE